MGQGLSLNYMYVQPLTTRHLTDKKKYKCLFVYKVSINIQNS